MMMGIVGYRVTKRKLPLDFLPAFIIYGCCCYCSSTITLPELAVQVGAFVWFVRFLLRSHKL